MEGLCPQKPATWKKIKTTATVRIAAARKVFAASVLIIIAATENFLPVIFPKMLKKAEIVQ